MPHKLTAEETIRGKKTQFTGHRDKMLKSFFIKDVHTFELARPMARRRKAYAATKKRKRLRWSQPGSSKPHDL